MLSLSLYVSVSFSYFFFILQYYVLSGVCFACYLLVLSIFCCFLLLVK